MKRNERISVSVIIPIYNVAQYLPHTLKCLEKQTENNFEVIFVDDHSSDESYDILMNCEKKFTWVKVIRNEKNLGAGECRNVGLEHAAGEYVLFLDADDDFENDLIDVAYRNAKSQNADVLVYYTGHFTDGEGNKCVPDRKGKNVVYIVGYPVLEQARHQSYIYEIITNSPFDKLVKRNLLLDNHIRFSKYLRTNDMSYSYESILCANRIFFLDKVLYFHRRDRVGSITNGARTQKSYIVDVLQDIYCFEKEKGMPANQEQAYWKFVLHRIYHAINIISEPHREELIIRARIFLKQYYLPFAVSSRNKSILCEKLWNGIENDRVSRPYTDILRTCQIELWGKNKITLLVLLNQIVAEFLYRRDKLTDYYVDEELLGKYQLYCVVKSLLISKINVWRLGRK